MTKRTILIVDDEYTIALSFKLRLENLGYEVINMVDNGVDAIYEAVEKRPDLVLLDIHIKGELTGIEAGEKILNLEIPVVYMTGDMSNSTFQKAIINPAAAYLRKPFDDDISLKNIIDLSISRSKIQSEKINLARGISENEESNFEDDSNIKKIAKLEYESSKDLTKEKLNKDFKDIDVYIVEDEEVIVIDLKFKLEDMGCNFVGASNNAKDAIEDIEKLKPDIVLLDLNLLGSLNGLDVANEIEPYNIPIIYISSNINEDFLKKALELAPYGFIRKPFNDVDLKNSIILANSRRENYTKNIIKVEDKVHEKNIELKIEKTNVSIVLILSSFLIIAGLLSRDLTWLQWILFIPSILMIFFAMVSLRKPEKPKQWDVPPFVSILIPAHNEEYTIADTVNCLAQLDYSYNGKLNYEILVLNDGSSDNTGKILKELKSKYDYLKIITRVPPRSGKGKGFVLNDGLEIAKGDVIAVFDGDTKVNPDFLKVIIPYLNDPEVDGVQSRVKMINKDKNWLTLMQHVEFAGFGNIVRAKDILGKAGFLGGNGQLVKKQSIIDCDGWDGFAVTEDLNLSVKLMIAGGAIRYCGETAVYQEAVPTVKQLFRQRSRWLTGNAETLFIYLPRILHSNIPIFRKLGIIEHVAFYGLNFLVFFGFIVFIVNIISWYLFNGFTIINLNAPIIVGIISAFGFFPGAVISLSRDHNNPLKLFYEVVGYWLYSFHLIPLYFMSLYQMLTRKQRTWAKTVHIGSKDFEDKEDIDLLIGN